MKKLILLILLFLLPAISWAEDTPAEEKQERQEEAKDQEPEPDSVWGALKYTGYHIEKGSVKTGHEIKKGSVKAGKTMEKGFKKTGGEIKDFFVGDDD